MLGSYWSYSCVHVPRRKRKPRRKPRLWFFLELMPDRRINLSMYHSTEGLVRSSQVLSRTNENFRLRVRFHFRPGTRTAYYYNEEQRDLTALPQESKEGIPWTWSSHYQGSCLAVNSPFGNYNRFFNQISYSLESFKSHPICLLTYVCVFEKVFKFLFFLICAFWCE